jgi:hypothetical protein
MLGVCLHPRHLSIRAWELETLYGHGVQEVVLQVRPQGFRAMRNQGFKFPEQERSLKQQSSNFVAALDASHL